MGVKKTENLTELSLDNSIDSSTYLVNLVKTRKQNSYFFICTIHGDGSDFQQRSFHKSELDKAFDYIEENRNRRIFVSTVLFETRKRVEETVGQIRKLLLDLDIYKSEKYKNMNTEDVLEEIKTRYFDTKKIPTVNAVTFSGGGIYLEWNLKFTPGGKVLQKRRVVMKILYEMLKEFNPDAKSLDAPHVFSLPDTINWKYGENTVVKTYRNDLPDYTLADIARRLPNLWDVWKTTRKIETKKEKNRNKKVISSITPIHKERTLAHDHIVSVRQLITVRNGEMTGYREMVLFFIRNAYHKMHSKRFYEKDESLFEESFKLALEVNESFTEPLTETEIQRSTFNDKKLYRFKTETINEWFDITLDEQVQIKVKTPDAKREKSKRQMRELRQKRGSISNEELEAAIREEILKDPKLGAKKIADIVRKKIGKCSEAKVLNVKKQMKKENEF